VWARFWRSFFDIDNRLECQVRLGLRGEHGYVPVIADRPLLTHYTLTVEGARQWRGDSPSAWGETLRLERCCFRKDDDEVCDSRGVRGERDARFRDVASKRPCWIEACRPGTCVEGAAELLVAFELRHFRSGMWPGDLAGAEAAYRRATVSGNGDVETRAREKGQVALPVSGGALGRRVRISPQILK